MNKNVNIEKILLSIAAIFAAAVMVVSFIRYRNERIELNSLKAELDVSTGTWKHINDEKVVIQKELREAKNNLREAELTIEESEERMKDLEKEIEDLKKEIESLKSGNI